MLYTLVVIILIGIIGFGAINLFILQSRSYAQNVASTKTSYLADAGIARARAELIGDPYWATSTAYTRNLGDGQINVTVQAYDIGFGSPTRWKVSSMGTVGSTRIQAVAWLERESLAKYAYFSVYEKTYEGTSVWLFQTDQFTGPVHTNSYFSVYGHPKFSQEITSANQGDSYYNSAAKTYTQGGSTYSDPAKFYRYYSSYSTDYPTSLEGSTKFSFAGGQSSREAPADLSSIRDAADYVIEGNVSIELKSNGTMEVTKSDSTIVTIPTQSTVVWVNGTIDSLKGVLKGNCTIAATSDVNITSDITYVNKLEDKLGIAATTYVWVKTDPYTVKDLEIDASILALNRSFKVDRYSTGVYRGKLTVFGGILQRFRGPVGTFGSFSETPSTGYSKNYIYDTRLRTSPPKGFPFSSNIIVRSWQDNRTLAH